jgi:hypothetical protein
MKIMKVVWFDAQSLDAWTAYEDTPSDLAEVISVGMLIKQTQKSITLALNNEITNGNYSCIMIIPRGWIKEFVELTSL